MKKLLIAFLLLPILWSYSSATDKSDGSEKATASEGSTTLPFAVSEEENKWLSDKMTELGITEGDIEEKFYNEKLKRGQKASEALTCVYLRHIPTGIEVKCAKDKNLSVGRFLARKELVQKIEEQMTGQSTVQSEEEPLYRFPKIPTSASISAGYRYIHLNGPAWISETEYEYPRNSLTLAGDLRSLPLPNRIHLEYDYADQKDYFGALNYSYRDVLLFSWLNKTLYHNLQNTVLNQSADPRYDITALDVTQKYGIKTGMNVASLRLKTPNFPFHIYADGMIVDTEGWKQQIFLGGSGYFDNLQRTSERRYVYWQTRSITVGANTHAGPIELDYSKNFKNFDTQSKGYDVSSDYYSAAAGRPAGTYRHNLVPDLKSETDTYKVHTSYTGRLVVSGTLSTTRGENEYSNATSKYLLGSADTMWMPLRGLTFYVKYRHRESDIDNPDSITPDSVNSQAVSGIRQSISARTDTVTGAVRYRPVGVMTVITEFTHSNTKRTNADEWKLPSDTEKDVASLSLRIRAMRSLMMKAGFSHEEVDAPAYNTEMDYTNKGELSASWTPVGRMFTYLSYTISDGRRGKTDYSYNDTEYTLGERKARLQQGMGLIGFNLARDLSLEADYAYYERKVKQALAYQDFGSNPPLLSDPGVPYTEKAHVIGANLQYRPERGFALGTGVNYTKSTESFDPGLSDALQPVSVSDYSDLKVSEIIYDAFAEYVFKGGSTLEVRYKFYDTNDITDSPYDDIQDGTAHLILAALTLKW